MSISGWMVRRYVSAVVRYVPMLDQEHRHFLAVFAVRYEGHPEKHSGRAESDEDSFIEEREKEVKRNLKRVTHEIYHFVDGERIAGCHDRITGDSSRIFGDCSYIQGDITGLFGDVSNIRCNFNVCEITEEDRATGIDIEKLIEEERALC